MVEYHQCSLFKIKEVFQSSVDEAENQRMNNFDNIILKNDAVMASYTQKFLGSLMKLSPLAKLTHKSVLLTYIHRSIL